MNNIDPSAGRDAPDARAEAARRRNRLTLIGIAALFIGPMLVAAVLGWSGYRPAASKAKGHLIDPPRSVAAAPVTLADGSAFVWRDPQWPWTLVALPGGHCAAHCRSALEDVMRMRLTLGRNAPRLRVLYLGEPLDAAFTATLVPLQQGHADADAFASERPAGDDTLALTLVDPGGLAMMQYATGFDVADVRSDLPKVIN